MEEKIKTLEVKLEIPAWFIKKSLGLPLTAIDVSSIKEGLSLAKTFDKNSEGWASSYFVIIDLAKNYADIEWISEEIKKTKIRLLREVTEPLLITKGDEISFAKLSQLDKSDSKSIAEIFFAGPRDGEAEIQSFKLLLASLKSYDDFHDFFDYLREEKEDSLPIFFTYIVPFCVSWLEKCNEPFGVSIIINELLEGYDTEEHYRMLRCACQSRLHELIIEALETTDFYTMGVFLRDSSAGSDCEKRCFETMLGQCDSFEKVKDIMENLTEDSEYFNRLFKKAAELNN